ncbi:MAG: hypothetical protein AAGJ46_08575 [Planctomycetota bacterium]
MAAASRLQYAYLSRLSQPSTDRVLYRTAARVAPKQIVEFGMGSLERTLRLISVCQRFAGKSPVTYAGFDWFEERADRAEAVSLIEAHRQLKAAGIQARLTPGGPIAALPMVANSLMGADLVLLSDEVSDEMLSPAWFYLPRLLHAGSTVFRLHADGAGSAKWQPMELSQIAQRAEAAKPAAAA